MGNAGGVGSTGAAIVGGYRVVDQRTVGRRSAPAAARYLEQHADPTIAKQSDSIIGTIIALHQ
jgi:hypothetical protein